MSFRIEQKLQIHPSAENFLMKWLQENEAKELYRERVISSIYFDTNDLILYDESAEGTLPRKKVRIRCYGKCDHKSGKHQLETKISSVEGRFKTTTKVDDLRSLLSNGVFDIDYGQLFPLLEITYKRKYFEVFGIRMTLDHELKFREYNLSRRVRQNVIDQRIAVELKANLGTSENFLLEKFPFPRIRFSKYALAVETLSLRR